MLYETKTHCDEFALVPQARLFAVGVY